jgi:hypothetical protein
MAFLNFIRQYATIADSSQKGRKRIFWETRC